MVRATPAAPIKARPAAAAATRAPTRSRATTDQLAQQLAAVSLDPPPKASSLPAKLQPRTAANRVPVASNPSKTTTTIPPKRATTKPVERAQDKGKAVDITPAAQASQAMRAINAALKSLSAITKSNWRASTARTSPHSRQPSTSSLASTATTASHSLESISAVVKTCANALRELRTLVSAKSISNRATDVEKAATSLVANLMELELYELALEQLAGMRSSLITLYPYDADTLLPSAPTTSSTKSLSFTHLLSIPLPTDSHQFETPILTQAVDLKAPHRPSADEIIPLLLAIQQYSLGCLFRMMIDPSDVKERSELLLRSLSAPGNPADWRKLLHTTLERTDSTAEGETALKKADAMMTSMFGTITKGLVGADATSDPTTLLSLRSKALLYYSTTRVLYTDPLKLDAFYDQTRKVFLLFGRHAEPSKMSEMQINQKINEVFEDVAEVLETKGVQNHGSVWIALCEVVLHVAKRAGDLELVERVSTLLGSNTNESVDPAAQVSQLCAQVISATAVLDKLRKEKQDNQVSQSISRVTQSLSALTRLRASDLTPDLHSKIDKSLERLRYSVARCIEGERKPDEMIGKAGVLPNDLDRLLFGLLDALVVHVDSLRQKFSKSSPPRVLTSGASLFSGAVDSLILLAYSNFDVEDRLSYPVTFASLERTLPLIGATVTSQGLTIDKPDNLDSIRYVVSALYKIGGTLYNASKPESAIKFIQRACQLGRAVIAVELDGDVEMNGGDAVDSARIKSMEELRTYMPKRWELLALAYHGIGDKQLAYQSYISAIFSFAPQVLSDLAQSASTLPISTLLTREPALYKSIQRSTRLATFDLLLSGSANSLRGRLEMAGLSDPTSATILELQLVSLEASLHKVEALQVIPVLLEDLLALYSPTLHPMRRARTLVRKMQHQCTAATVSQDLSAAAIASEVDSLCSQIDHGEDTGLRSFAPQYLAFSHLWLGFYAHQSQSPSESTSSEARQALNILRAALDSDIPASPSVQKSSPARVKVASPRATLRKKPPIRAPAKSSLKTPVASRTLPARGTKLDLVTPPRSDTINLTEKMSTPRRLLAQALLLDEPERCYEFLETMAYLLGALGYSLLRISYLKFLRRLSIKGRVNFQDGFVTTSAHLAHEYLRLGKTSRAGFVFAQAESKLSSPSVSAHSRVVYQLLYAEYLAVLANHDRSAQAYANALAINEIIPAEDPTQSTTLRIVERTLRLQRSALAASVCSVILQRRGDLTSSLNPAMQALRVWNRALANISRLSVAQESTAETKGATPFASTVTDLQAPLPDHADASRRKPVQLSSQNSGLVWSLSDSLANAFLRVSNLYALRGTPKSAEHFAQQAIDLATDLGSTRALARALTARAEVRMYAGNDAGSLADLDLVSGILGPNDHPEAITAQKLRADLLMRQSAVSEAQAGYLDAQKSLDVFVEAASEGEPLHASPTKPVSTSIKIVSFGSPSPARPIIPSDRILPSLHAYLLRMQVCLLRIDGKQDESQALLARLSQLNTSEEDKADEFKLLASIQLQELLSRFGSDPVLGMLQESVLSMPALGIQATKLTSPTRLDSSKSLVSSLREVENLLRRAMAMSVSRSAPANLRDISLHTAALRTLQLSVGRPSKSAASAVASVLDLGLAVTLRREMLDAIDYKLDDQAAQDDFIWPTLDDAIHPPSSPTSTRTYWTSIRDRYRYESPDLSLTDAGLSSQLPKNWTVVSIHLTAENDSLILVRHTYSADPVIFKLPLDRLARREGDEDAFSYADAMGELKEIIRDSNTSAQNGKFALEKEGRAAWWKERKELDARLKLLTENLEDVWLGAFKSVFLDSKRFSAAASAAFKMKMERIVKRSITRSTTAKSARLKLDDSILNCLSALPPSCRDEDLEDLFYFIMESFQFTGVPVAYDEIDVDQVVIDLRTALEELHAYDKSPPSSSTEHIFLILDKTVQSFPWESIPTLQQKSISRIPSIAFLRDRIDLAAFTSAEKKEKGEMVIDSRKTSFVINAEGDLKKTELAFTPWLERMKAVGWTGITGRAPMEEEVKSALVNKDLFLYFGHGGAEQYIRSQTLRRLPRCATTMLWGCSSGHLKDLGDFDPIGTPYHYMVAGCPALVANLWDVTDKDIDKFSETVFQKLGLDTIASTDSTSDEEITLAGAVATSREVCNLRYLNGAAPVVYGIPVRFTRLDGGSA